LNNRHFKQFAYHEIAAVVSALGEPRRIEILELLCQCERNVETLAQLLDVGITTASHHLQILKRARLVESSKVGRYAFYSATDMAIALWGVVSEISSRELTSVKYAVEKIFEPDIESEPIDYNELIRRIESGEAVLLDVRPEEEYAAGHLPGALSLSLEKLHEKGVTLPRDKPIFAYCRGRFCVLSLEATQSLVEQGYNVSRLPVGIAEWKSAGVLLQSNQNPILREK